MIRKKYKRKINRKYKRKYKRKIHERGVFGDAFSINLLAENETKKTTTHW